MYLIILFMKDLTLPDRSLSSDSYSQVGARVQGGTPPPSPLASPGGMGRILSVVSTEGTSLRQILSGAARDFLRAPSYSSLKAASLPLN